jgi:hypothetical protein
MRTACLLPLPPLMIVRLMVGRTASNVAIHRLTRVTYHVTSINLPQPSIKLWYILFIKILLCSAKSAHTTHSHTHTADRAAEREREREREREQHHSRHRKLCSVLCVCYAVCPTQRVSSIERSKIASSTVVFLVPPATNGYSICKFFKNMFTTS